MATTQRGVNVSIFVRQRFSVKIISNIESLNKQRNRCDCEFRKQLPTASQSGDMAGCCWARIFSGIVVANIKVFARARVP